MYKFDGRVYTEKALMACSLGGGAVNNSKEPDAVRRPGLSKKVVNAILCEHIIIHFTFQEFYYVSYVISCKG